ncbi:MAG: InlB B-repeat-containing protein, partial [Clostridia bacterium]|nr:InlB B-repeat-containing protein [Clostridia bacterium]
QGTHTYGAWTIVNEPTETTEGKATRTCDCTDVEEKTLPVLTDATVWSVTETPANYNAGGSKVYTSEYGTVTVSTPKLVAPYDSKTYAPINFDADANDPNNELLFKNGTVSAGGSWSSATVTLDENATGNGTAFPFRGQVVITMTDAASGKINFRLTGLTTNDDGETVLDPESVSNYVGYVDPVSGIIIRPYNSKWNDVLLLTPFEAGMATATTSASSWDGSLAIQYTFGGTTYSAFIYKDRVHFGVSFVGADGEAIAAADCYNAASVYVKDASGALIEGFVHNGEKLVVADGLEGAYTNGDESVSVSGYGTLTYLGKDGTYVKAADGADYTIGAYVDGNYYEFTLTKEGMTYAVNKPMVTLTFDAGDYATVAAQTVNKNIAVELPEPTNDEYTFKGWFFDEACTEAVPSDFVPTQDDVLYASWKAKVVINLVGVLDGDNNVLLLGEGDVIGAYLPEYGIDTDNMQKFTGWYLDDTFETSLPEEATVSESDSGFTIYAKWEALPAYCGTYYGSEIWNASYGNKGGKTLTIDENGKMTGTKTGIIIGYDPATQVVEWKTSETATTSNKFYFNAEIGVIAGLYNNNDIGNDYYLFSKYDADGIANASYGVKAAKSPTDSSRNYYAQFVNITTKNGDIELFLYNNYIYHNFTATDASGNALTAATVKNSKTVIVKDANGNVIVSVASEGSSFADNNTTVDLDAYYGTYAYGDETVVLDGVGGIVYGDKTGTYALAGDKFDVYFADNTEYYELTLDTAAKTCVITKPMVTITFDAGEYATLEAWSKNKNIAVELPVPTNDTNVFNGWFFDEDRTEAVPLNYVPTENVTLYALWKTKVTLTVVYNNGAENGSFVYSEGDTVEIADPKQPKFKFVGWYTTETFNEGTEWTAGEIAANTTIYAKWEVAPAYYNTYLPTRYTDTKENGGASSYKYTYTSTISIDAEGTCSNASYPFGGDLAVTSYDKETGAIVIQIDGTTDYRGYLDADTGLMVLNYVASSYDTLAQVVLYVPVSSADSVGTSTTNSSYWNSGKTRTIEYTYVEGDVTKNYTVFVFNNKVYFGVSFVDGEGNALTTAECYGATTLFVKDKDGNQIAKFGYDGTTMQALDGYEGEYANGDETLTVDGVKNVTLNGVAGTYTLVSDAMYTMDAYVDNNYYQITLNKTDMTYTIVRPEVTITFDAGEYATVAAQTVNMNIAITLPEPENENYIFRGWYTDSTFETAVATEYVPVGSITLYAKWDVKVTLTVVYGNGLENAVLGYGVGDTTAPVEPAYTNGQAFDGWYLDDTFETPYEAGEITENTTIYCKWLEKAAYTVTDTSKSESHAFTYDETTGIWTSGNAGVNSSSAAFKITAATKITVTFQYFCESEKPDKWDYLAIKKNGTAIYTDGGDKDKVVTFSETITVELQAGDTLEFVYTKDSSSNTGLDQAQIKDLKIDGVAVTKID